MAKKQKLELTWIGKDDEVKLEPRVLIEDPELSYGDSDTENMIIHGDNLLALKALEQDYAGKVKCIYIDPPYNTGNAFEHYDDGLEHSIWLNLFYERVTLLHKLLDKDGVFFVQLDDNELDYAKVLLDQVFYRRNFVNRITIEARSPSAFSTVNPGVFKSSEYILIYAKNKLYFENRSIRIPTKRDIAYNKFIINRDKDIEFWELKSLKIAFLEQLNTSRIDDLNSFILYIFSVRGKTRKELEEEIKNNFKYSVILDIKKLSSYLYTKLKDDDYEVFYNKVYQYLLEKISILYSEKDIDNFVFNNASAVWRETEISDSGAGKDTVELKYKSLANPDNIYVLHREGLDDIYIKNGKQMSFYSKNMLEIDSKITPSKLLTNIWTDISWEGIAKEGQVTFKKSKKPEALIRRILELSTNENDLVLDSFLGSGTTTAVAHKMKRRYIGIELGEHAKTLVIPRLKKVIDGEQGGISENVNWQGGGGFKFYTLAPSLLKKDRFDNWVIEPSYDADLLASALAKQEAFTYHPDSELFWKQGYSTENDFIFTTTQFITVEMIDRIHEEMGEDESLLICAKSFQDACVSRYDNITLKKIPKVLLGKCEFGKDDYSLNITETEEVEADDE